MSEPMGRIERITLHWSAGNATTAYPAYHLSVRGDGGVVASCPLDQKGAHTWGRNTGNVGVSLLGHPDKGFPAQQIENVACVCAEVAYKYGLDLDGSVDLPRLRNVGGVKLVAAGGVIHAPVLADHAWYAHADGYYPDRWDVGKYYAPIAGKSRWYLRRLQKGERKPQWIK